MRTPCSATGFRREAQWAGRAGWTTITEADRLLTSVMEGTEPDSDEEELNESKQVLGATVLVLRMGERRPEELTDGIEVISQHAGMDVAVVHLDPAETPGAGLEFDKPRADLLEDARIGRFSGAICVPPSRSWGSRSLLDARRGGRLNQGAEGIRKENLVAATRVAVVGDVARRGGAWVLGHRRGASARGGSGSSIWNTDLGSDLSLGAQVATVDQCEFGSSHCMPITLIGSPPTLGDLSRACQAGPGGRAGRPRNRVSNSPRSFPSTLSRRIAVMFLEQVIASSPAGKSTAHERLSFEAQMASSLPGTKVRAPAMGDDFDPIERWAEVFRTRWSRVGPSNVLEAIMLSLSVRHVCRSKDGWGRRVLIFTDSLVALCTIAKARPS